MNQFVKKVANDAEMKKAIRQEIGFQKILHPLDAKERSHLYRMNYLGADQMIENLIILLDDEAEGSDDGEISCLPTEEETMDLLQAVSDDTTKTKFVAQQPIAVVWHNETDQLEWSVGFFLDEVEAEACRVDHLESKDKVNWMRPAFDDIQVVKYIQILPIEVIGDWDFSKRHCTFTIKNADNINEIFKKL